MNPGFERRLALHSWTLDTTPLPEMLRAAREAGYAGVELRYVDFKRAIERGMTPESVIETVRAGGIPVVVLGVENGLIFARGEEHGRLLASLEQSCRNAVALGCPMLMMSPGQNAPTTLKEGAANFKLAAEVVQRHGVKVALEFNSHHPILNCIDAARELIAHAALPATAGILLDTYHMHFSGSPGRGFEKLPAEEIFAFQFSDAPAGGKLGVRSPTNRLPPGRGAVKWTEVLQLLAEKDYRGYLDYEAPNPAQWSRPPDEVAREGIESARSLIATAFSA